MNNITINEKKNNSCSEDNKIIISSDFEKFIHKAEEKIMNKQVEDMKDTNRYLWSSKNKIEKQRRMIQKK